VSADLDCPTSTESAVAAVDLVHSELNQVESEQDSAVDLHHTVSAQVQVSVADHTTVFHESNQLDSNQALAAPTTVHPQD